MTLNHLAIIGFGAIAHKTVELLAAERPAMLDTLTVLCRDDAAAGAEAWLSQHWRGAWQVITSNAQLLAGRPDLAVECAGQSAIDEHVVPLLSAGVDCVLVSVGALAAERTYDQVRRAAETGASRAVIASGAVGGLDILSAYQRAGIAQANYTGRKPPHAWLGSPAEKTHDLGALVEPTLLFEGNAREAALAFPKNANVAATIALAGAGFENTRVRLIADPAMTDNTHEIEIRSRIGNLSLKIEGRSLPDQPRTSAATAYSALREILNRSSAISI